MQLIIFYSSFHLFTENRNEYKSITGKFTEGRCIVFQFFQRASGMRLFLMQQKGSGASQKNDLSNQNNMAIIQNTALSNLISDFKTLEKNGFYSVTNIELWMEQPRPNYLELKKDITDNYCHRNSDEEEAFLDFYEVMVKLLGYHQNETYLQNELEFIGDIDKNSGLIIEWLKKNEKLALDELGSFWCEWLDENFETISLSFLHFKEFNVFIKAEEFKNTIQFLSTFDKLYWESDLGKK